MKFRTFRRATLGLLSITVIVALSAIPSLADSVTLNSGNSVAHFNTKATDVGTKGLDSWTVNGVQQVSQDWIWYRVGAAGGEASLDTLTQSGILSTATTLEVLYTGAGFTADVKYSLAAGATPTSSSDLQRTITIQNTSGAPLNFHLFEYSDYDLAGTAGGDTVHFVNANNVVQTDGVTQISEAVLSPSHSEAAFFNSTLASLSDGNPTTLSDTPAVGTNLGPGDVTWAYQWDPVIAAGGSFITSPDSLISTVPEPSSIALVISGLLGLGMFARRRIG
jgi:hypothetical protein